MDTTRINASELCSRKLWDLVNAQPGEQVSDTELSEAIAELSRRRRYLQELQEMGKLERHPGR